MSEEIKRQVYEGALRVEFGPRSRKGDVWLQSGGTHMLADAVLDGPGGCFIGKRVRITIEVLEGRSPEIPGERALAFEQLVRDAERALLIAARNILAEDCTTEGRKGQLLLRKARELLR